MVKRKPAMYVNAMASEMAHGAFTSGFDILERSISSVSFMGSVVLTLQ